MKSNPLTDSNLIIIFIYLQVTGKGGNEGLGEEPSSAGVISSHGSFLRRRYIEGSGGGVSVVAGSRPACPTMRRRCCRGGAADHEHTAAGGAVGVSREPRVDAADVESVAAVRQDADLVALRELGEADGALREAAAHSRGGVRHLGQRLEGLLLEPLSWRRGESGRGAAETGAAGD